MTIDPAILRAMQAAGASIDVIIAAVEADAALEASKADKRRAKDAERQRRHRASRDVTVTERDSVTAPSLSRPLSPQTPLTPTHTHPDNTTGARKADPFPMPEWTTPQVWADLKANRKAKRLPCTPTAHAKLLADLDRLASDEWPPGRLLEAIVARGWAAAYDPRETRNDRQQRPQSTGSTATAAAGALAILEGRNAATGH